MPSRLPTPGGDPGSWGAILNDFLSQSLQADGSLKGDSVDSAQIKDGAVTDAKVATSAAIAKTKLASDVQASLTAADNAIPLSQKGASGGVASLTGTTLTTTQIPSTVVTKSTNSGDAGKAIDAYTGSPIGIVNELTYNGGSWVASNAKFFVGEQDPATTGGNPAVGDIWINTGNV